MLFSKVKWLQYDFIPLFKSPHTNYSLSYIGLESVTTLQEATLYILPAPAG